MQDVLIDWKNMAPTSDTKEQTEAILKSLKFILPPDSDIRVSIERHNKLFETHVTIRSPLGDFAAHAEGKDLFGICRGLKKNLKQQIFRQKETRASWSRAS